MKIKVRESWLQACGRDAKDNVFQVVLAEHFSRQGCTMYHVADNGFTWCIAQWRVESVIIDNVPYKELCQ